LNLDKLNSWFTLGANLGVLFGILFLVVEVQQNNLIARAQIRMDIADSMHENIAMFSSQEGVSIQAKLQRGEDLTLEDEIWLVWTFRNELKAWESVAYQHAIGFYDQVEMETYREIWKLRAQNCKDRFGELFLETYQSFVNQLRPSFKIELDNYFTENNCFK